MAQRQFRITEWKWKSIDRARDFLLKSGFFKKNQAESFAYHVSELLEASQRVEKLFANLIRSMSDAKNDARRFDRALLEIAGEMMHIPYHIRFVERQVNRLLRVARCLPPYKDMTDEEIGVGGAKEAMVALKRLMKRHATGKSIPKGATRRNAK